MSIRACAECAGPIILNILVKKLNKFLITRGMLVAILYRAEGEPAVNKSIRFSDVDANAYYANAVIWAQQNGIVNGVTENEFTPDDNITREQIAAIMFRYAKYKG